MISKCPWWQNVHDGKMSMMGKCPWCPNVHDVVIIFTYDPNCHMWSHLSHVVGLAPVTFCHMCHTTLIWVKNQCFQCWPKSEFIDWQTRPTYRPARPQVKTNKWCGAPSYALEYLILIVGFFEKDLLICTLSVEKFVSTNGLRPT